MKTRQLCDVPTCTNYERYCRLHSVILKEQPTIEKVSEKQKDALKIYQKLRREYLKENPVCKFNGCKQKAKDIHHMAGRTGDNLTDVSKFLGLCREHHTLVELNPSFARQHGYSLSRLAKTEKI